MPPRRYEEESFIPPDLLEKPAKANNEKLRLRHLVYDKILELRQKQSALENNQWDLELEQSLKNEILQFIDLSRPSLLRMIFVASPEFENGALTREDLFQSLQLEVFHWLFSKQLSSDFTKFLNNLDDVLRRKIEELLSSNLAPAISSLEFRTRHRDVSSIQRIRLDVDKGIEEMSVTDAQGDDELLQDVYEHILGEETYHLLKGYSSRADIAKDLSFGKRARAARAWSDFLLDTESNLPKSSFAYRNKTDKSTMDLVLEWLIRNLKLLKAL